ncbi:hypothetical protein GCM10018771_05360 [Streptomyces cellulosae]|nr:hypothetical protein GCM10018771_05360 [Streptomyces cellulosae]
MTATHAQPASTTARVHEVAPDGARASAAPPAAAVTTSTAARAANEVRGAPAGGCWLGEAGTGMERSLGR